MNRMNALIFILNQHGNLHSVFSGTQ